MKTIPQDLVTRTMTSRLQITRMDCVDCRDYLTSVLEELTDVDVVVIHPRARVVTVAHPPSVSRDLLIAVAAEHGFDAALVK